MRVRVTKQRAGTSLGTIREVTGLDRGNETPIEFTGKRAQSRPGKVRNLDEIL